MSWFLKKLHVHDFKYVLNDPRNKVEILNEYYGKYTQVWKCKCGKEKVTIEKALI